MFSLLKFLSVAAVLVFQIDNAVAIPTALYERSNKAPTMPLNGLTLANGLQLQHVALGMGTQNYTCTNTSSAPVAAGAVASLYDATSLFTNMPLAVSTFPALAYSLSSSMGLPTLGHHWFSASSVPTFSLENTNPKTFLSAAKVASVAAPTFSVPNSVPWLYLADDGRGVSVGLQAVYRVVTAGGSAPATCDRVGDITVKYAAEYWFYK